MRKKKTDEEPTEWVLKRDKRLETLKMLEQRIVTLRVLFCGVPESLNDGLRTLTAFAYGEEWISKHSCDLEYMVNRNLGMYFEAKDLLASLRFIMEACPDLFEVLAAKLSADINAFTKERRKECARRLPAMPAC